MLCLLLAGESWAYLGEVGRMRNRPWTTKEAKFALENYAQGDHDWIAEKLGRTKQAVRMYCQKHGVFRDPKYFNGDRFMVGDKPWNTGLRGFKPKGAEKTYFTKETRPKNDRPIGAERISSKTLYRKISEGNGKKDWKPVKNIVWESVHGPIPEGMIVTLKVNNVTDCSIENLICVTRGEHLKRNAYRGGHGRAEAMKKGWITRRQHQEIRA